MRAKSHKVNFICLLINPYEKEIPLYMTLHASIIITFQCMWIIFPRNGQFLLQQIQYFRSSAAFFGLFRILFKSFLY